MAVVGNSYLYHMRKDLVENIEPGVAQVRSFDRSGNGTVADSDI